MKNLRFISILLAVMLAMSGLHAATAKYVVVDSIPYMIYPNANAAVVTRAMTPNTDTLLCAGNIVIPDTITTSGKKYAVLGIDNNAFRGCTELTSITMPSGLKAIGEKAFYRCTGLTSVTIPDSVTHIGEKAFYDCRNLSTIHIPATVQIVRQQAFAGTAWYTAQPEGLIYVGTVAYAYKSQSSEAVCIKEGTTFIADRAFQGSQKLEAVTIPPSVTAIGDYAFKDCTALAKIDIPGSVTSIGDFAFYNCTGLKTVNVRPSTLESVGLNTFTFNDIPETMLLSPILETEDEIEDKDLIISLKTSSIRQKKKKDNNNKNDKKTPSKKTNIQNHKTTVLVGSRGG